MRVSRGKLVSIGIGTALLLTGGIVLRRRTRASLQNLQHHTYHPAHDYNTALESFQRMQAEEEANPKINPVCRSYMLTHGKQQEHVIVLLHGMTNCPHQYDVLASLLYEQGYTVLVPLVPHNGLLDLNTDDLKHLTAEKLRDFCSEMIDIAHGLGKYVTCAGLSVGGVMTAWIAQNRADVDRAVVISPSFNLSPHMGVIVSRLSMYLLLLLPNIMTQHIMPIKEGPFYNYRGFATRGLAEMMRLGFSTYDAAGARAPAALSIAVVTNDADPAVSNRIALKLMKKWQKHLEVHSETYSFAAQHKLIHDLIDPLQKQQQTALVYPILLPLLAPEKPFTPTSS